VVLVSVIEGVSVEVGDPVLDGVKVPLRVRVPEPACRSTEKLYPH